MILEPLETNFLFMLARSLAALAIVVGLIYVFYRLVLVKLAQPSAQDRTLRVRERLALGPQTALYVVQGPKKGWLIGISARQISLIDQIPLADLEESPVK